MSFSTKFITDLIIAYKKNDKEKVDNLIKESIEHLENTGKYNAAKQMRDAYSFSYTQGSNVSRASLNQIKNENKLYEMRTSDVSIDDIVLSAYNNNITYQIISDYKNRETYRSHGLSIQSRILLYGPPGTGKTMFAYALAGELKLPIMHIWLDELISSYLGETGKNIKKIFEEAINSHCIIFLDEFDTVAKQRDDQSEIGELKRVVTVLLQHIDNLKDNILIAATNHYHILDIAIIRRFEYLINLDILDSNGNYKLMEKWLDKYGVNKNHLKKISEIASGISGSYIRQLLDKALKWWLTEMNQEGDLNNRLLEEISLFQLNKVDPKNKEKIIKIIDTLRNIDPKKYTYSYLEEITNIPHSTLHYLTNKKNG